MKYFPSRSKSSFTSQSHIKQLKHQLEHIKIHESKGKVCPRSDGAWLFVSKESFEKNKSEWVPE